MTSSSSLALVCQSDTSTCNAWTFDSSADTSSFNCLIFYCLVFKSCVVSDNFLSRYYTSYCSFCSSNWVCSSLEFWVSIRFTASYYLAPCCSLSSSISLLNPCTRIACFSLSNSIFSHSAFHYLAYISNPTINDSNSVTLSFFFSKLSLSSLLSYLAASSALILSKSLPGLV